MEIRQLTIQEITEVYHKHLKNDFPDNERKPLFVIKSLIKRKLYQCYGLFAESDNNLKAYAFLCKGSNCGSLILDYFATVSDEREKGYGSQMIKLLRDKLTDIAGIVAEVEHVADGQDLDERQLRQRRIDFYRRNGFSLTRVDGMIFGVHYDIVYLPIRQPVEDRFVLAELEDIYRAMLPEFMFQPNVHLRIISVA